MNRPRSTPTSLTRKILEDTPDDCLYMLCVDYVLDTLHSDHSPQYGSCLPRLPVGLQMAWHISGIEFEVPNGGFYQFFSNSTGIYVQETLDALTRIGAGRMAEVLEEAIGFYEREYGRPADSRERWFGSDGTPWNPAEDELDRRFCEAMEQDGIAGFAPYVRQHLEEFIHAD